MVLKVVISISYGPMVSSPGQFFMSLYTYTKKDGKRTGLNSRLLGLRWVYRGQEKEFNEL